MILIRISEPEKPKRAPEKVEKVKPTHADVIGQLMTLQKQVGEKKVSILYFSNLISKEIDFSESH